MTLPKELITVTLVSRIVELIVLVAAMIISFGIGVNYQETIDLLKQQNSSVQTTMIQPTAQPTNETVYTEASRSANWKTYTNERWKYQISYPPLWKLTEQKATGDVSLASQETTQDGSPKFFIEINVWNRSSRDITMEEEVKQLGYEQTSCPPGPPGPATGAACTSGPKTISKKSFPNGNAYYLVVTATDKKIAIMPTLNEFIEITSSVWPKGSEELFDQILLTFRFTNP